MSRVLIKTYKRLLDKHFLLVQSVQTGILLGTGDCIAQTLVEQRNLKQYDFKRTLRFTGLGVVLVGPALTTWYRFLAKVIGNVSTTSVVLKKVALDQLLFAPCFCALFITAVNLMNGHGIEHIKMEFKEKYVDIVLANYKVWPAVQLFNFHFMPLQYQVLLVQGVAIFWNAYLSWKTQHRKKL